MYGIILPADCTTKEMYELWDKVCMHLHAYRTRLLTFACKSRSADCNKVCAVLLRWGPAQISQAMLTVSATRLSLQEMGKNGIKVRQVLLIMRNFDDFDIMQVNSALRIAPCNSSRS